jgi:CheY-like chemotaxis protein
MNLGDTTVFYVDDNPKGQRLLAGLLTACGFRVITANDPLEALARCASLHFDLALLDYRMPFLSGSQLAQELKSLAPCVPIVLISGYTALAASEVLFVDAHFGRDTVLDDLLVTMWSLLSSKRMNARDRQAARDSRRIRRKTNPVTFDTQRDPREAASVLDEESSTHA